jgi:hypothetical protein
VRSADERWASVIERCERGSLLDCSGTDRHQECHHTTLRHGNERCHSQVSYYELTEDAKDATLLDVRMVMSGSFDDARMLHVLYGPCTSTMLRERVD